jgi:hypothetical protein
MAKTGNHSARDTAVGFYFQGLYALVVLLDADDLASAIIEGEDDIQLDGPEPKPPFNSSTALEIHRPSTSTTMDSGKQFTTGSPIWTKGTPVFCS